MFTEADVVAGYLHAHRDVRPHFIGHVDVRGPAAFRLPFLAHFGQRDLDVAELEGADVDGRGVDLRLEHVQPRLPLGLFAG